jgi:large subunit ribosomal protein L25
LSEITIQATPRQRESRHEVNAQRKQGKVPGVLYGHQLENQLIWIELRSLQDTLRQASSSAVLGLTMPGLARTNVMVKEVQFNPLNRQPLHIDLQAINMNVEVQVAIPLQLEGDAPGVKAGGILQIGLREVEVRALPKDLPNAIVVDISQLNFGDSITVADVQLPAGLELVSDVEQLVATIVAPSVSADADAEAAEEAGEQAAEVPSREENPPA